MLESGVRKSNGPQVMEGEPKLPPSWAASIGLGLR